MSAEEFAELYYQAYVKEAPNLSGGSWEDLSQESREAMTQASATVLEEIDRRARASSLKGYPDIVERFEKATPGPHFLATGCSWRRILTVGDNEVVCRPTNAPDGHPDLSGGMGNLEFLAGAWSDIQRLLSAIGYATLMRESAELLLEHHRRPTLEKAELFALLRDDDGGLWFVPEENASQFRELVDACNSYWAGLEQDGEPPMDPSTVPGVIRIEGGAYLVENPREMP